MPDSLAPPDSRLGTRLTLDRLRRVYPDGTVAADEVTLDIAAGEFITLLGPSGSGKTTTLKMVAGFERPDGGDIRLGERSLVRVEPHDRNIGMVFQNYALFPHMTVFENVAFPLKMRRRSRTEIGEAVARTLAMVHLEEYGRRYPKQLSGGQQQRVALARALVFRPPLLLMDEPLGALDRQLRKEVQHELKRITRDLGITALFVTHDQDEALFLSDRIAIMNEGRIVQIGTPEELYAAPDSRFAAEFLGETNFLDGTLAARSGDEAQVDVAGGRLTGTLRTDVASGAPVVAMVRPEAVTLAAPEAPGLRAWVRQVNFLGNAREYELQCTAGALVAHVPARALEPGLAPGAEVSIQVAPRDCLIFGAAT